LNPTLALGAPLVFELLALGVASGFLAGLLGVGGGMLLVPFLTLILSARGVDPALAVKMAVATSMATILFTSLSSLRAHHRLGAVRWGLARRLSVGIVLGGLVGGGGLFALLKGQGLALLFTAFVGVSAVRMLRDARPGTGRRMPGPLGQAAVGAGIGIVSGLLGAGGAFLSVPFMVRCDVPMRLAVGTSAALGFPIALANVVGYLWAGRHLAPALPGALGFLYLPALAVMALASVTLAPLGARVAHRIDVSQLRRLFALMLLALAASMLRKVFG
jgi:uncharacterized membrane protein YfcA